VIAAMLVVTLLAHTPAQIADWVSDWNARVAQTWITTGEIEEYRANMEAMRRRRPVPHHIRWSGTVEQWRPLVERWFDADEVETALRVMACESGGDPNAVNVRSGAAGLFQHLPKYWPERSRKAGWEGADIFDPEANIAVAAWLQRTGGWRHWVCWDGNT